MYQLLSWKPKSTIFWWRLPFTKGHVLSWAHFWWRLPITKGPVWSCTSESCKYYIYHIIKRVVSEIQTLQCKTREREEHSDRTSIQKWQINRLWERYYFCNYLPFFSVVTLTGKIIISKLSLVKKVYNAFPLAAEEGRTGARCPPPPHKKKNKKMCPFFMGSVPFLTLNDALVAMLSALITFWKFTKIEKRTVRIIFLNWGHKIYIYTVRCGKFPFLVVLSHFLGASAAYVHFTSKFQIDCADQLPMKLEHPTLMI